MDQKTVTCPMPDTCQGLCLCLCVDPTDGAAVAKAAAVLAALAAAFPPPAQAAKKP